MKKTGYLGLICAAVLAIAFLWQAPISVRAASTNLLTNPSFTGDLSGWTGEWGNAEDNVTAHSTISRLNDGSGSLKITNPTSSCQMRSQNVTLVAGTEYVVSFWLKIVDLVHSGAGGCGAFVNFGDEDGGAFGNMAGNSGETGWVYYESTYIPLETKSYGLQCRLWGCSGSVYFDDVSIKVKETTLPEADEEFAPTAVKALKKAGIYDKFPALVAKAAVAKNVSLVADGRKTIDGVEYFRVSYLLNGEMKKGYVKRSELTAEDGAKIGSAISSASVYESVGGTAIATLTSTDNAVVKPCENADYWAVFGNCNYNRAYYVKKSEISLKNSGSSTDRYTVKVDVVNGSLGTLSGISAGEAVYESGSVISFNAKANEGCMVTVTASGGHLTEGFENYAYTVNCNATITLSFKSKEGNELYPYVFMDGETPYFNTWCSGNTEFVCVADSAHNDGTGSLRVTNETASHVTININVYLVPHTTYKLSGYVRCDINVPGSAGGCGAWFNVGGDQAVVTLGSHINGDHAHDWQYLEKEFTVATPGYYPVALRLWGASGTVYFDEISVKEVSKEYFTNRYAALLGGRVTQKSVTGLYEESATVVAVANPGYVFTGWSDGVKTPNRTDRLTGASYTANFKAISKPTITYTASTGGYLVGEKFSGSVNTGTTVVVAAVPEEGYTFTGWSDGVKTALRSDVITKNLSVQALFEKTAKTSAPVAVPEGGVSATLPTLPERVEWTKETVLLPKKTVIEEILEENN